MVKVTIWKIRPNVKKITILNIMFVSKFPWTFQDHPMLGFKLLKLYPLLELKNIKFWGTLKLMFNKGILQRNGIFSLKKNQFN